MPVTSGCFGVKGGCDVDAADYALELATDNVLEDVRTERIRQRETHGWTPSRDDSHPLSAWSWLLSRRAVDLAHPHPEDAGIDERRILVEIGAIAVAAIESWDRKAQKTRAQSNQG